MIDHTPATEEEIKALYARLGKGLENLLDLMNSRKEPPQNASKSSKESLREMLMETARRVRLEPRSEEEYQQAKLREFQMFERGLTEAINRRRRKKERSIYNTDRTYHKREPGKGSVNALGIEGILEKLQELENDQSYTGKRRRNQGAVRTTWEGTRESFGLNEFKEGTTAGTTAKRIEPIEKKFARDANGNSPQSAP